MVQTGSPWIWLNAGAVAISVILVVGLISLIAVRGLGHFWPGKIVVTEYQIPGQDPRIVAGKIVESEEVPAARLKAAGLPIEDNEDEVVRDLLKVGNRDIYGSDFAWVVDRWLVKRKYPENIVALERREWGDFYGFLESIKEDGVTVSRGPEAWNEFQVRLDRALDIHKEIYKIERHDIGAVNAKLERLRLEQRSLELKDRLTPVRLAEIEAQRQAYDNEYRVLENRLGQLYVAFNRDSFIATTVEGREVEQLMSKIVRAYRPNAMTTSQKVGFYFSKIKEFVTEDPREANTEGGVFPAIFGTVMMVILMSIIVTPFGVVAAVYLREYASQGWLTRAIRIAVNNLAGCLPLFMVCSVWVSLFILLADKSTSCFSRKHCLHRPLVLPDYCGLPSLWRC